MKKVTLFLLAVCWSCLAWSQNANTSGDQKIVAALQDNASFNVVFAVLLVILLGIIYYLFRLDRKVTKMENEIKK